MYQTIILPIDTNNTEAVPKMLEAAERLGGKGLKVILLNVIETVPNYVSVHLPEDHDKTVRASIMDSLNGFAESTALDTETAIRSGHPSTEILEAAEEMKADAIVVASHRPGFEDVFLGSTAARIVRRAKCSVLVIR